MQFANVELAHRLEFAEAYANRKSVEARAKMDPSLVEQFFFSRGQRNAERSGFRIAYTRTKWQLGR